MDVIVLVQALLVLQLANYLWIGCDATCLNRQSQIPLNKLEGTISYRDNYKRADCSYVFPTVQTTEYDIMLAYITKIDMQYPSGSGCAADVSIGDMKFCKMPDVGCFLYYTTRSGCGLDELHKIFMNGSLPCNKTSLMLVESFPPKFRIESRDSKYKSVTLKYQYIKCQDNSAAPAGNGQSTKPNNAATTPSSVTVDEVMGEVTTTAIADHKTYTKCPKSHALVKASSCNAAIGVAITLGVMLLIIIASLFGYQSIVRRQAKFHVNREDKTLKGNTASSREEISRLST